MPRRVAAAAAVALCAGTLATPALGQAPQPAAPPAESQPADPYDGRLVRELRLLRRSPEAPDTVTPVPEGLDRLIRNQIRAAAGQPFSRDTVRDDITRLNRLGRFKTIQSDVQLLADGSVILTYTLEEQPVIQDVMVVGNREITDQDIMREVAVLRGTPVDRFQIDRAARRIEDLYRAKGYYQARVEVDEQSLAESDLLVFRVLEGQPVRVTQLLFEGNNAFTPKELRAQIKTTTYKPIFERAPLDDTVLNDDEAALVRFYRDRGYLDARVDSRVRPSPNGKEASVTFEIDEGPLYTLRSVQVRYRNSAALEQYRRDVLKDEQAAIRALTAEQMRQIGRRAFTDEQISGLMAIKPGDVYSDDKLRKSIDAIERAYGKLGYVVPGRTGIRSETVLINPQPIRDERRPEVDLILFITEGEPTLTGEIVVTGNDLTKQQVILREMQVRPGRPLDAEALQDSRDRLERLRLFKPGSVRLTLQPEDRLNPGTRDVLVEVAETNTGEFNIGAAIDSESGVIGQVSIIQRNFDIADVPDSWSEFFSGQAFRGAGQTASLQLQPGQRFSNYSFSLTEPHLFESDYSATGTVFWRERDYKEFDEDRIGAHFLLGRRFGSVWRGVLSLRVESVDLGNIEPDKPVDIFDVQDGHLLTGVGIEFSRQTTDDPFRPTRGSRLELGVEQVGLLGGDFDFTRLRYTYAAYIPVYESFLGYKTVLKLENRVEYIPQGQDSTPVYERLYLGGRTFRAFRHRTIAPKGIRNDTGTLGDDPVGGSFLFFLGAELHQPIYEDTLSLVGFIDTGTVEENFGFTDYRVSAGMGLRLFIPQLSRVPIAFDFGFPIISQDGDRERVFTFSIDIPFQ